MTEMMLHMHQIRDFIDNRYEFYNKYFKGVDPRSYSYKGVQKAFQVGNAVDYALKTFYMNLNEIAKNGNKNNVSPGDGVLDSKDFKTLPTKIDMVMVQALVQGYISRYYSSEETKEYFHNFRIVNIKIPVKINNNIYTVYASPDLIAFTMFENKLWVLEIKTSGDDPKKYSPETLDFQTMTYAWAAFYKSKGIVPAGVIKRTLMKPRIKQKKDETEGEFIKRLVFDVPDKEEQYFKSSQRKVDFDMIVNYENYLIEILKELDECVYGGNEFKYYKDSKSHWGI